ncbi:zinc finger protein 423-like isoform X1 [Artemia franciscana]|nr:hypothetical protein QYM36_007362 [Artemia franciscana]
MLKNKCAICRAILRPKEQGFVDIFSMELLSPSIASYQITLSGIMTDILSTDVTFLRSTEYSKLCRSCLRSIQNAWDLQTRLEQVKIEIKNKFLETSEQIMNTESRSEQNQNVSSRKAGIIVKEPHNPSTVSPKKLKLAHQKNGIQEEVVQLKSQNNTGIPIEYQDLIQSDGTFKCRFCKRKFIDFASNLHHMVEYHKALSIRCNACDDNFKNITDLRRHRMQDHPNYDTNSFVVNDLVLRSVVCNRCDREFPNVKCLNIHVRNCHLDGVPLGSTLTNCNFSCKFCGLMCQMEAELLDHLNEDHWVDKPYCCHICLQAYSNCEEYTLHVSLKHQGRHICSHCKVVLPNATVYETHVKSHYQRPQIIMNCKYCVLKFTDKGLLEDHVRLRHSLKMEEFEDDKNDSVFLPSEAEIDIEFNTPVSINSVGLENEILENSYPWNL